MRRRLQNQGPSAVRAIDVARLAGCSTATVSRVQNTPHLVSVATRDRVHAAIRQLGYTPNSAARTLRSRRSGMIGIVIPTLNHAIYASLVEAAQRRLADGGYLLLVATFEYDLDREAQQAQLLVERGTEGLILVGGRHRPELHRTLETSRIPHINTYVYRAESPHPCIGIDNVQASFEATEFLYSLGHRCFGVVSGATTDNDRASARLEGVRLALAGHGIELDPSLVVERPYSIASGREALRLLRSRRPAPTAIVCGNDILALGVLIECREIGLSVPAEVSIVGFDDLDFTSQLTPPLTTIEVPASEMGAGAAGFLLDTLRGRPTPHRIRLETKLIARRTTAVAPAPARPVVGTALGAQA